MPEKQQGQCPFHRDAGTVPQAPLETSEEVFQYAHQVYPTTICPGLEKADFICSFGRTALRQDRVLAFDVRNLSGAELWMTLLDGIREYVHGDADNFLLTFPETDFLNIRDLQHSAMDLYTLIQMALSQVAMEICVYDDLQKSGHIREPISSVLKSEDSIGEIDKILSRDPYKTNLAESLRKPDGIFQSEARAMYNTTENCKRDPNSPLELVKIIQLNGVHLVEGRLHAFYMGPTLESDRYRYNPHHILVFTKATAFTPQVLGSDVTRRIHALIETEEVSMNLESLLRVGIPGEDLFLGNKHFAIPCPMPMSKYFELPVKSSRPTDSLLPAIRANIQQAPKLSTVPIEGGFQIGENIFLIDQANYPKVIIKYTFNGQQGSLTIQDVAQFYEDMGDLYKRFCATKTACIYQRVQQAVTQKTNECSVVFTVTRDVENLLK